MQAELRAPCENVASIGHHFHRSNLGGFSDDEGNSGLMSPRATLTEQTAGYPFLDKSFGTECLETLVGLDPLIGDDWRKKHDRRRNL